MYIIHSACKQLTVYLKRTFPVPHRPKFRRALCWYFFDFPVHISVKTDLIPDCDWWPASSQAQFIFTARKWGSVFSAVCDYFFCLCLKYLRNGWTDLRQIHREDMFGPSFGFECHGQRSKVKVTRDKKTRLALPSPPGSIRMANSVHQQRTAPFRGLACGACLAKTYLPIVSYKFSPRPVDDCYSA